MSRTAALAVAATVALGAIAPTVAEAATPTCTIAVHPWDGVSRKLEVVHAGGRVERLIDRQGRPHMLPDGGISFAVAATVVEVRWVLLDGGWKERLPVASGCQLGAYHSAPGHGPSLSMRANFVATTTTAPATTTTSSTTTSTTTSTPTTVPPTTTTTTSSSSTVGTLGDVQLAPPTSLARQLPATGASSGLLALIGGCLAGAGAAILASLRRWHR